MAKKAQIIGGEWVDGEGAKTFESVNPATGAAWAETGCDLSDVVKAMVWLRDRDDFPGFNKVYGDYFPEDPPARSAVVSELLVDVRVEIEVVAYKPE